MPGQIERLSSLLLTIAALVIAVSIARRELFDTRGSQASAGERNQSVVFEPEWELTFDVGVVSGPADASVRLVQFADLECSACRDFESRVLSVARERYRERLGTTFVHFPLPYHRFARIAAQATECADSQQRFQALVSLVYIRQDSIGLKPWSEFAMEAGIADTVTFSRCLHEGERSSRIEAGFELGQQLQVRGTPTVMINGWRFSTTPSLADLTRTIDELLDGRRPSLAAGSGG